MSEQLWTGPAESPRRYVVGCVNGRPRHEPGSGSEGFVYRARINDGPEQGTEVALKHVARATIHDLAKCRQRLRPLENSVDPRLMRVVETFVGPAFTDDESPDPADFDLCWIVSEWIEGRRLNEVSDGQGALFKLSSVAEVARAVAVLHRLKSTDAPDGIVHLDVKTSNVRVRDNGGMVLIDYGLLRPDATHGTIGGTLGFMAPEVMRMEAAGKPADVYGVGAIAHDLIIGDPPRYGVGLGARDHFRAALVADDVPLADDLADHVQLLLADDPARRGDIGLDEWADGLDQLLRGQALPRPRFRPRRRHLVAVGATLVATGVIAAGAIAWWPTATPRAEVGSSSTTPASTSTTTTTPPCESTPAVPDSPEGTALAAEFATLGDACAGAVDTLVDATVLPILDHDAVADGYLLTSPSTPVVRLTPAQYSSYREIAGRSQPDNAALYGGYPVSVEHRADPDVTVIELSTGGLIVGRRDDTQSFWVPQQARGVWESRGGIDGDLGIPTSNVFFSGTKLMLEFEHGYLEAVVRGSSNPGETWLPIDASTTDVVIVPDPAAALRAAGDPAGRVVRQSGGTAWWVDDDGIRHWISDGGTWVCLDAESKLVEQDIPGYAVATLALGPAATCADK